MTAFLQKLAKIYKINMHVVESQDFKFKFCLKYIIIYVKQWP